MERDYGKKGIDDSQVAGFEMGIMRWFEMVYQDRQRIQEKGKV